LWGARQRRGIRLTEEQERWLAVRCATAAMLDPETAEVTFTWGDMTDPYGVRVSDENSYYGRNYFARGLRSMIYRGRFVLACRRGGTLAR